ncbi:MAG: 30S ribosomal protein S9, partial [Chloroflexi bacterium]|nr:30S ribosomal protein S9 [Chloroflexota bacterium]
MTDEHYYYGTGRRKNAVARVRLFPGAGEHIVNERPMEELFTRLQHRYKILQPLVATEATDKFHAQVKVAGGGITGWADAIAHGIAR